ncbi:hypothetical protein L9W97_01890 [Vibrio aestuarianus]|uniref:hypothetical protein n=1 Tax=Vibrio aestuarianus TaxID=28171 RepID=UPI00237CF547|nr:hypothetical protein [Vibrio aestuarianus]MDE1323871.1 hypothetical protein [Vibrio aestuarianus]
MGIFTLLALLLLIVSYGILQYRKLLKWKHELEAWKEYNQDMAEMLLSWHRTLEHREKVWKEFKLKVEKDLKWNWKI